MSVIGDLYDDLIGDPQNLNKENVDGPLFWQDEAGEQNGNAENDYVSQTIPQSENPVQPKQKRVVRNPQPKLNPERLKGPRGVATLEDVFKDHSFCGKGYEKRDLDQVMKKLEHWAHRLFPKYQFDDCLEKLESLGHKKTVMVYVKKIRMGLETSESSQIDMDVGIHSDGAEDTSLPIDHFDELLSQQLLNAHDTEQNVTPQSKASNASPKQKGLTEEQRQRMEKNRLIALERRLARIKAFQERQVELEAGTLLDNHTVTVATGEECKSTGEEIHQTQTSEVQNIGSSRSEHVMSEPQIHNGEHNVRQFELEDRTLSENYSVPTSTEDETKVSEIHQTPIVQNIGSSSSDCVMSDSQVYEGEHNVRQMELEASTLSENYSVLTTTEDETKVTEIHQTPIVQNIGSSSSDHVMSDPQVYDGEHNVRQVELEDSTLSENYSVAATSEDECKITGGEV